MVELAGLGGIAAMTWALPCPRALTIGPDEASTYSLPFSSQKRIPSARSINGRGTVLRRE
jgi:hypothetical protein